MKQTESPALSLKSKDQGPLAMPKLAKQPPATSGELEPMLAIDEVARILGISRRSLERLRVSKSVPEPDMVLGKMPRWKPETIRAWINSSKGK